MNVEDVLNHPSVRVQDRKVVLRKLNDLIKDGSNQLVVISDFDFTLTRFLDEHNERCLSSHSVLDHLLIVMHPELEEKIQRRNAKYMAIEYDPKLTKEDKVPFMIEWWNSAHESYVLSGIHRDDIESFVMNAKIKLRDGAISVLQLLATASIPLLLFSAGIGNVIDIFLRRQLGTIPNNLHIISNMLLFNDKGVVSSCSEPLIHVYCKDSSVIPKDAPFFDNVAHRRNVLLLGDSLGDLHMDIGIAHAGTVLKIGFLNNKVDELLSSYLDGFDIVIVQDQTIDVPSLILSALIVHS
ncbi:hypothetical protein KIN20_004363 [Parelaphostrongylus tenuis]|uniref:5'-nucleotidase n=1 Tax=Parelaphostrongylus tenuis TaxID=148309 RepID=A0AAD5QHZ3_PARTN|nr:hypothetical protein KIN20_004363 [Parelaphostrongylus tenuis]